MTLWKTGRARSPRPLAAALLTASLLAAAAAEGAPLTPGNLLVTQNDTLVEYTTAGVVVQSFSVPYAVPPRPGTESVRDIVPGSLGQVHVYDGTFDPYLNTLDPATMSWTSQTLAGWSTVNNLSYGGIARVGSCVFVTDMATFGAGDLVNGLLRFQLADSSVVRFTQGDFIDTTMGFDGLLYALSSGESTVTSFNPSTLAQVGTLTLAMDCRGIAVNAAGHVFGASWDGNIYHFDPTGALLGTLPTGTSLNDIDLTSDGKIAVGARFGEVTLTDESLATKTTFMTQGDSAFVAFTTPPPIAPFGACGGISVPLGGACAAGVDCQSGFCADGVCCETACAAGACDACSVAAGSSADGTCTLLTGNACDDGDECTQSDTCAAGACVGADPVVCPDPDQCHEAAACDPSTGLCESPAKANGEVCDDGDACTQWDTCQLGVCSGSDPVVCVALGACHLAGTCDPATGLCDDPLQPDGEACDDGDACTQSDTCQTGMCLGANPVFCAPGDDCQEEGTCDPTTGACTPNLAPDGTWCTDGLCRDGVCTESSAGGSGGAGGSEGGSGGTPETNGGCGCTTAGTTDVGSGWLGLALGLLWLRRPRRRPRRPVSC